MTQLNGRLGQLGDQEELLLPKKVCSRKRQMQGCEEPCESRGSSTVVRPAKAGMFSGRQ
jgi:hypothetical protein